MAGWEQLGEVLGGGIDRQGAFQTGMLRSAQTESALGMARQRQLENIALETKNREREKLRDTLAANPNIDPTQVDTLAAVMLGNMGSDFKAGAEGMGEFQTQGFRSTLADPEAPLGDQFAAGQGLQEQVLPRYAITGQTAEDLFNRDAPLAPTPVGQAQITLDEARAADPDLSRWGSPSSGGTPKDPLLGSTPAGMVKNPAYDPTKPVGDGNYPFINGVQPVMGSREANFYNRVAGSADAMQRDIANLMRMPFGTNIGILGVGPAAGPDVSAPRAIAGALKYQISEPETVMYNAMLGGMNRALAFVEGQGLVGSNQIASSYDTLLLRPGETLTSAMFKIAQMKQTVIAGLSPHLTSPRVPAEQKEALNKIVANLNQSVPFEVEDIIALQFGEARNLREAADLRRGAAPGAAPAASASGGAAPPREFASEAEAEAAAARGELQSGTKVVVGGIPGTWQ